MKKKVAILFSGGVDSAYLLQMALEKGYDITLIYTKMNNNPGQQECELKSIENILSYFRSKYPQCHNLYDILTNEILIDIRNGSYNVLLQQVPVNVFSALLGNNGQNDEVWIGYVKDDDASEYCKDIAKIFSQYKKISHPVFNDGSKAKFPKLRFPILDMSKLDIVTKLDKNVLLMTHTCENPINGMPCNGCNSCKRDAKKLLLQSYPHKANMALNCSFNACQNCTIKLESERTGKPMVCSCSLCAPIIT